MHTLCKALYQVLAFKSEKKTQTCLLSCLHSAVKRHAINN